MSTPALELVIDLPFLAGEINDAHRQVAYHAKGMLLEAKRAGDALLAAKGKVKHGEFKAWVEAHCRCSYETARQYLRVAKIAQTKMVEVHQFEGGVRAFLDTHAKPRITPPSPTPTLTPEAAERVLNIQARVERGEGAEKDVAASKLAALAADLGMPLAALLEQSRGMCPDREKSVDQVEADSTEVEGVHSASNAGDSNQFTLALAERINSLADRGTRKRESGELAQLASEQGCSFSELLERAHAMVADARAREAIRLELQGCSKQQLFDLLVEARLRLTWLQS